MAGRLFVSARLLLDEDIREITHRSGKMSPPGIEPGFKV